MHARTERMRHALCGFLGVPFGEEAASNGQSDKWESGRAFGWTLMDGQVNDAPTDRLGCMRRPLRAAPWVFFWGGARPWAITRNGPCGK